MKDPSFNSRQARSPASLPLFSSVAPLDANNFYTTKSEPEPMEAPRNNVVEEVVEPPTPPMNESIGKELPAPTRTTVSINDTLVSQPRPTLVDNFQKIAKIKESLTINQKFMFTKVLFHGDFELFSQAIDHLDKLENIKSALRYIEDEHAGTWDHDSEEFHEFMELVEKRFS